MNFDDNIICFVHPITASKKDQSKRGILVFDETKKRGQGRDSQWRRRYWQFPQEMMGGWQGFCEDFLIIIILSLYYLIFPYLVLSYLILSYLIFSSLILYNLISLAISSWDDGRLTKLLWRLSYRTPIWLPDWKHNVVNVFSFLWLLCVCSTHGNMGLAMKFGDI